MAGRGSGKLETRRQKLERGESVELYGFVLLHAREGKEIYVAAEERGGTMYRAPTGDGGESALPRSGDGGESALPRCDSLNGWMRCWISRGKWRGRRLLGEGGN